MASLKPRVSDFFGELGLYTLARYFFFQRLFLLGTRSGFVFFFVCFCFFSCAQLLIFAKLVRT